MSPRLHILSTLTFMAGLLLGTTAFAVPRLNEIVADNTEGGLLDQDGDLSDWVSDADGAPRHTYRFTNALVGDPSSLYVRLRVSSLSSP